MPSEPKQLPPTTSLPSPPPPCPHRDLKRDSERRGDAGAGDPRSVLAAAAAADRPTGKRRPDPTAACRGLAAALIGAGSAPGAAGSGTDLAPAA